MMDINLDLIQWLTNSLIKSLLVLLGLLLKVQLHWTKQLTEELQKTLENLENVRYTLLFEDNIWGADIADM